jgi:hypothetical protein
MLRNRATWCRGLCDPVRGIGACGRMAPHQMTGRTQRAILRRRRQLAAEAEEQE